MQNYLIPPIWVYRNVFCSLGLRLLTLFFLLLVKYSLLVGQNDYEFIFNIFIFIVVFLVMIQLYRVEIEQKTPLQLKPTEKEIMSDRAQLISHGYKLGGRIILTNKRLSFIANNRGKTQFDFFLLNPDAKIIIKSTLWIPSKIKIPNEDIYIKVKFPYWWRKMFLTLTWKSEPNSYG